VKLQELCRRVGDNARELRESIGMTGFAAAAELDVDERYVRRVESGEYNLTLETLLKLSTVYRVDPSRLLRPRKQPLPKRLPGRPAVKEKVKR